MIVFAQLDRAIAIAAADEKSLLAGRSEWNLAAGMVHDDEPLYEERAAAFLDWFTLDRAGPTGVAPVLALAAGEPAGTPERAALVALGTSHHSLFRVRERATSGPSAGLLLEDLWGGALVRAAERRALAGVGRGDLLDARVIADVEAPPLVLLGRIVCVHPREAEPTILRYVDEARRARERSSTLLFRLLRLRVRCERYRHVSAARVYEAGEPR